MPITLTRAICSGSLPALGRLGRFFRCPCVGPCARSRTNVALRGGGGIYYNFFRPRSGLRRTKVALQWSWHTAADPQSKIQNPPGIVEVVARDIARATTLPISSLIGQFASPHYYLSSKMRQCCDRRVSFFLVTQSTHDDTVHR